jgi:hypothetical protein
MRNILLTTVASVTLLATPSFAMNFTYSLIGDNKDALAVNMTGEIVPGDANRFYTFYKRLPALPVVFILDSPGGIVSEAGTIGDDIRGSQIATAVGSKHRCASACFMLFAAGTHRYATPDASIGIHGASSVDTDTETVSSYATDVVMARTLKAWGVPDNIVGKMVTTPSHDIYWLTMGDLTSMGVVIVPNAPAPSAPAPSVPLANLPPMVQKGLADRTAWELWFESLPNGDYRDGAEYWAGQRSLSPPGSCYGSADFNAGCVEAKERLDPTDRLRKSNPDYKLGWNAYGP